MPNERPKKPESPGPDRFAFSTFIDALPDAIVVVDRSGRIVELNIQTVGLFGYARTELLGEPVEMLLPERLRTRHVGERDRYDQSPHVRLVQVTDESGIGLPPASRTSTVNCCVVLTPEIETPVGLTTTEAAS